MSGRHRGNVNVRGIRIRGISKGPIIAAAVAAAIIAAVVGWMELREKIDANDRHAATACVEGTSVLNVTADPDIAPTVQRAADAYNAAKPRVRDHCATVLVTTQPTQNVAVGLGAAPWNDAMLGPRPALWIPQSSLTVQRVRVPGLVEGEPRSLAASRVVLAVPAALRDAFVDHKTGWADLPSLQQTSLGGVGLASWGPLGLALPPGDATLAGMSALAGVAGGIPVSEETVKSGPAVTAVGGLAAHTPAPSSPDPLAALAAEGDPATARLHAVIATEQQVQHAGDRVVAYQPIGADPTTDHPAVLLKGDWVDGTQNQIAALFTEFMLAPAQQKSFGEAGFVPPAPLTAVPSKATLDRLAHIVEHPTLGISATVLVDVSSSMGTYDGQATRLATVAAALGSQLDTMPSTNGLGLWWFGKNLDGDKPYKIAAATGTLNDSQRRKLTAALTAARVSGTRADRSYPTLDAAVTAAHADHTSSLANTVLLITDGPDDDSEMTGEKLLAAVAAHADPTKPIRVDIVVIGSQDTATLQTLAKNTGGAYTRIPTSNTAALGTALGKALAP